MALKRARAAELLTQLVHRVLAEHGVEPRFPISESLVTEWLLREGKGVGCPQVAIDTTVDNATTSEATIEAVNSAVDTPASIDTRQANKEVSVEVRKEVRSTTGTLSDWELVWMNWLELMKRHPSTEIDVKSKSKILERLGFGFTVSELGIAMQRALANPALVGKTRIRAISRPLQTDQQVCKLLDRPYKPRKRSTWMSPFDDAWKLRYPTGTLAYGVFANCVSSLVVEHGAAAVLDEFQGYIDHTEIEFVSWPRFKQGYGIWANRVRAGRGRQGMNQGAMLNGLEW